MFGIYVDIIIYTDIIFYIFNTNQYMANHNIFLLFIIKFINYNKSANFDAHFSE